MTGKKRIFAGMGILLGVLVGVQGTAAYQSAYDKAGFCSDLHISDMHFLPVQPHSQHHLRCRMPGLHKLLPELMMLMHIWKFQYRQQM